MQMGVQRAKLMSMVGVSSYWYGRRLVPPASSYPNGPMFFCLCLATVMKKACYRYVYMYVVSIYIGGNWFNITWLLWIQINDYYRTFRETNLDSLVMLVGVKGESSMDVAVVFVVSISCHFLFLHIISCPHQLHVLPTFGSLCNYSLAIGNVAIIQLSLFLILFFIIIIIIVCWCCFFYGCPKVRFVFFLLDFWHYFNFINN